MGRKLIFLTEQQTMDFRLELHIKPWKDQINLQDKIMLIGSCFTEHMSERFGRFRFAFLDNPHGILFNPLSITKALKDYTGQRVYTESDLFYYDGLWQSWNHHGRFAAPDAGTVLSAINEECLHGSAFIRKANWLIITLGSSFIYELKADSPFANGDGGKPVANCHKVPAQHFNHHLLSEQEVYATLHEMVTAVRLVNPAINLIFTVSPVRHYREGLVENNRSKGRLHSAVGDLLEQHANVYYFPAYELVIDDLRDYRFYAEDLVHPNYFATRYVWEKFADACIDPESLALMEKMNRINAAMQHRPRQPESEQHRAFLHKMYLETQTLAEQTPFLNWEDALAYFKA